jgi:hypothetical protein
MKSYRVATQNHLRNFNTTKNLKKLIYIIFTFYSLICKTQISPSGCYISGGMSNGNTNGCGNTPDPCNLAASGYSIFGVTNCGNSVVGSGGAPVTVSTSYILPAGCTATVFAQMAKRPSIHPTGCNNSGADGGDYVQITNTGGTVISQSGTICCSLGGCGAFPSLPGTPSVVASSSAWTTGCSNADMLVKMVITGGQVNITGRSDRGDEFTTFTLNLSGTCGPGCDAVLPILFTDFYSENTNEGVTLKWNVNSEIDINHYEIEKSNDGINWNLFKIVSVFKHNVTNFIYQTIDNKVSEGNNYYKLSLVNKNNEKELLKTIYVNYNLDLNKQFYYSQTEFDLYLFFNDVLPNQVYLQSTQGMLISFKHKQNNNCIIISKENLAKGLYLISTGNQNNLQPQKIIVE